MSTVAAFHALGICVPSTADGEIRTLCPSCSNTRRHSSDPCLSVNLEKGVFVCHHCGWKGHVNGRVTTVTPIHRSLPQPNAKRRAALQRTWDAATPLVPGDPVTRYLANRGLALFPPACPPALRYHAALRYYDDDGTLRGTFPAMVACIRDAAGHPASLHRTYLTAEGTKAPVPKVRKFMRPALAGATRGGAIRLYPATEVLAVGEGIETALSIHRMTGLPVWAAGSAGGIGALVVPPSVRLVVICADHDVKADTLALGAQKLAQTLLSRGCCVKIVLPERRGTDWNDVFQDATALRLTLTLIEATPAWVAEDSTPAIQGRHLPDMTRPLASRTLYSPITARQTATAPLSGRALSLVALKGHSL